MVWDRGANYSPGPDSASSLKVGEWFALYYPPTKHVPILRVKRISNKKRIMVHGVGWNDYEQSLNPHRRVYRQNVLELATLTVIGPTSSD